LSVEAALDATATVEAPRDSDSEIALKPVTSDFMTCEIEKTAALSFAEPIFRPVEIWP